MIEQGWTLYFICLNVLCIMNNENDVEESLKIKIFFSLKFKMIKKQVYMKL